MILPKYLEEALYFIFINKLKPIDYWNIEGSYVPMYWKLDNKNIKVPYLLFKRTKDEVKQRIKLGEITSRPDNFGVRYWANYKLFIAIHFYKINLKDYFRELYASRFDKYISQM